MSPHADIAINFAALVAPGIDTASRMFNSSETRSFYAGISIPAQSAADARQEKGVPRLIASRYPAWMAPAYYAGIAVALGGSITAIVWPGAVTLAIGTVGFAGVGLVGDAVRRHNSRNSRKP